MQEQELHIEFPLSTKESFRIYLDTVKYKLLIGLGIYAIVVAVFLYFLMSIGETKFLLEASPLFLGFPALTIGGQLLRVHAYYRKSIADLSESEKIEHYVFLRDGSGYEVRNGESFLHINWSSVRKASEKPRYFEFQLSKSNSHYIPKNLITAESTKLLREIIRARFGDEGLL
jgi:hypothetical protein